MIHSFGWCSQCKTYSPQKKIIRER